MEAMGMPVIESFDDLSKRLRLTKRLVYWLSKIDAKGKYNTFYKKKKSGNSRRIDAPVLSLKITQKWILKNILYKIDCSKYSYGFQRDNKIGKSPQLMVAEKHSRNLYILKLDIKDFYPSIKRDRVFYIFRDMGYNKEASNLLANICTYENSLPQGAPSSACLANLICRRMDSRIAGYCNRRNIIYTRYADDIIFSSNDRNLLYRSYKTMKLIIESEGFFLNNNKTYFRSESRKKEVLGITINGKNIKCPKKMKRMVRSMIHHAVVCNDYDKLESIKGYISYIGSVEDAERTKNGRKKYKEEIKEYINKLTSSSELSTFPDVVNGYNAHKIYSELPDMVNISYTDIGMSMCEYDLLRDEHDSFVYKHDVVYRPNSVKNEEYNGNILKSDNIYPFKL